MSYICLLGFLHIAFFHLYICLKSHSVHLLSSRLGIWGFDNMSLFENLSDFLERDSLRKSTGALELIAMNLKTAGKVPFGLIHAYTSLVMVVMYACNGTDVVCLC